MTRWSPNPIAVAVRDRIETLLDDASAARRAGHPAVGAPDRSTLRKRALWLAWATVAWNVIEAVVAIAAGTAAGSVALIGFGLDSTIEVAKQTMLCTYLSAVLLLGLVLNATVRWWWTDAVTGLVIAVLATREGLEAWQGDTCCD